MYVLRSDTELFDPVEYTLHMAGPSNLEQLQKSLSNASHYPRKCFGVEGQEHTLRALEDQLNRRSSNLFSQDGNLRILEVNRTNEGPYPSTIRNETELERHLLQSITQHRPDPRQRYIFIHADDSREPLQVTRGMLLLILAYHQVTPGFLEFVFPFGRKTFERDSYFSGFRSDSLLGRTHSSLQIGAPLNRSGRHIEMFYHLKSVERSSASWSIRQCSIHHKFDLVSQQSTWVVVKANAVMRRAIHQQLKADDTQLMDGNVRATLSALGRSLAVHRTICSWAGDNWHWYIGDLESRLSDETRDVMSSPLDYVQSGGTMMETMMADQSSVLTPQQPANAGQHSSQRPGRLFRKALRRTTSIFTWKDYQTTLQNGSTFDMTNVPQQPSEPEIEVPVEHFKIGRIQEIQSLEDETNKAMFILKANCRVLRKIQQEYITLSDANEPISKECESELDAFQHHLDTIFNDLEMLQPRLETLLRMAADRKTLVQQILQYSSTQAAQTTALRGQDSAESMERMTLQMHRMTEKTVQQTASMNIITFVTLLFLPGTFISVQCATFSMWTIELTAAKTLMSTPIVNFAEPTSGFSLQNIGVGALELYLVVSLPLLCLTVLLWIVWYLREKRNQRKKLSDEEWQGEC